MKLVMIDNYDSFTYNLVQYLGELGCAMHVYRNDHVTIAEIEQVAPDKIIISPGPCTPKESGISPQVIKHFSAQKVPVLGVCLGHQTIAEVFGGTVVRARRLMHGKTSQIFHDGQAIYQGLEDGFTATRYHSLCVEPASLPDCFEVTSWAEEDEIMGIRHKDLPVEGVQFHPESILTKVGLKLLQNFIEYY